MSGIGKISKDQLTSSLGIDLNEAIEFGITYELDLGRFVSQPGYFHIEFVPKNPRYDLLAFPASHKVTIDKRNNPAGEIDIHKGTAIDPSPERELVIAAMLLVTENELSIDPELLDIVKSYLEITSTPE